MLKGAGTCVHMNPASILASCRAGDSKILPEQTTQSRRLAAAAALCEGDER